MISYQFPCFTNVYFARLLPDVLGKILPLILVGLTEGEKHAQLCSCSLHASNVRLASRLPSWAKLTRDAQRLSMAQENPRDLVMIARIVRKSFASRKFVIFAASPLMLVSSWCA